MLIEQTIEFELKGPGTPGRTCTPIKPVIFTDGYKFVNPLITKLTFSLTR